MSSHPLKIPKKFSWNLQILVGAHHSKVQTDNLGERPESPYIKNCIHKVHRESSFNRCTFEFIMPFSSDEEQEVGLSFFNEERRVVSVGCDQCDRTRATVCLFESSHPHFSYLIKCKECAARCRREVQFSPAGFQFILASLILHQFLHGQHTENSK